MKNFAESIQTISGAPVKNLRFNTMAKLWLGQVWDEKSILADKWTSASWRPSGYSINKNRMDLNLK